MKNLFIILLFIILTSCIENKKRFDRPPIKEGEIENMTLFCLAPNGDKIYQYRDCCITLFIVIDKNNKTVNLIGH